MQATSPPIAPLAALDHEAHVWLLRPATITDTATLAAWRSLLSDEERTRLGRFRRDSDRHTFLVAHALVRLALSHYASVPPGDWKFAKGRLGRPEIEAPVVAPLAFSLAHTDGLVACVVARECECGIDVESVDRRGDLDRVARRVLSTAERGEWEALPESERRARFLIHWTLKEAYLKARSVGLTLPPRNVSFCLRGEQIRLASGPPGDPGFANWRFWTHQPTASHTLATAIRPNHHPPPTLVVREGLPPTQSQL